MINVVVFICKQKNAGRGLVAFVMIVWLSVVLPDDYPRA